MKKKTKQKTLWFLLRPGDDEWAPLVLISQTGKELRAKRAKGSLLRNGQHVCGSIFKRLLGFLPKVPTKITFTWEE